MLSQKFTMKWWTEIYTTLRLPSGSVRWEWMNALNISTAWERSVSVGRSPTCSTHFIHDSSTLSNASKYTDSSECSCARSRLWHDYISQTRVFSLNSVALWYWSRCSEHKLHHLPHLLRLNVNRDLEKAIKIVVYNCYCISCASSRVMNTDDCLQFCVIIL